MRRWGKNLLLTLGGALVFFFLTVFVEERQVFLAPLVVAKIPSAPGRDEEAMMEAVRAYNERVVEAYARRDPSLVRPGIAGDELADLIAADIRFLAAEGRTVRLQMIGLKLEEVRGLGPARARLTVIEDWAHDYRDAASGARLSAPQRARERVTYDLAKIAGRWRVAAASHPAEAEDRRE